MKVRFSPTVSRVESLVATSISRPAFAATETLKPALERADTTSSMPLPPPMLRLILLSFSFSTKSSKT